MDFNSLMAKMRELDQPVGEAAVKECGEPMMSSPSPMGGMDAGQEDSVNMNISMNAQGSGGIRDMLAILKNIENGGSDTSGPMGSMDDGPDMLSIKSSPLQLLPGMDDGSDHGMDDVSKSHGDLDNDGDHDMDDHDMEDEGFGNGLDGSDDSETFGIDSAIPNGNDLNKKKMTFPKVAGGDNPMLTVRVETKEQLRASIREELMRRLQEAKGAK